MMATRPLSFARPPLFEPFWVAMGSFLVRPLGMPSPSASAARMTSLALVARRPASDSILILSSGGTRSRMTGLPPASTLRLRPLGVYGTENSSARSPTATSLTFELRRAVSRTSAAFSEAGILTRMLARFREVLADKVLADYQPDGFGR